MVLVSYPSGSLQSGFCSTHHRNSLCRALFHLLLSTHTDCSEITSDIASAGFALKAHTGAFMPSMSVDWLAHDCYTCSGGCPERGWGGTKRGWARADIVYSAKINTKERISVPLCGIVDFGINHLCPPYMKPKDCVRLTFMLREDRSSPVLVMRPSVSTLSSNIAHRFMLTKFDLQMEVASLQSGYDRPQFYHIRSLKVKCCNIQGFLLLFNTSKVYLAPLWCCYPGNQTNKI